jgi:hypothetical protein
MDPMTVAVDLAKDVFEVALANRGGRIFERKRLTRAQFERFIDGLTPGTQGRLNVGQGGQAIAAGKLGRGSRSRESKAQNGQ